MDQICVTLLINFPLRTIQLAAVVIFPSVGSIIGRIGLLADGTGFSWVDKRISLLLPLRREASRQ